MADMKTGDEALVFDRTDGRKVTEYPGEVVKVGRTLVTIAYGAAKPYRREAKFRIATGMITDSYGGAWFRTLEQAAAEAQAEEATRVLHEAGLEIRLGHRPSGALLVALAEVAKTFGQED
jgi:hypothetical protein